MKVLLIICLFLIAAGQADAQFPVKQQASLSRTQIKEAERRLSDIGYWTGPIDGLLDPATREALIAFQKYSGRNITGELTLDELEAIRSSTPPKVRDVGYEHVEVDLDRQVLLMINDAGAIKVLPVSTGSGQNFIDEGETSVAYTPRGRFIVYNKKVGWEYGPLGSLYYANYISAASQFTEAETFPTNP